MRTVNKVILIGNVCKDAEMKELHDGQILTLFTLATNREWQNKTGEQKSTTELTSVAVWGKLAELAKDHVKRGKAVYIEGYLRTRKWEQEGVEVKKTEVICTDLVFLDKKQEGREPENGEPESDPFGNLEI